MPLRGESGQTSSAEATAGGVELSIEVTQRPVGKARHISVIVSVTVESTSPVVLKTYGGIPYQLVATDASGTTVFDSLPVDAKASGEPATHVGTITEVGSAGSRSGTYEFTLERPGRYSLGAHTFGPKVDVQPLEVTLP